jgi:murein DD-endopeptidase MepM/ murein hydrolase activator NlpD
MMRNRQYLAQEGCRAVGVRSSRTGVRAALVAGALGLGVLTASVASPAGAVPVDPDRDIDELNESIQDFAEQLLDAHADAVTTALAALETAQSELDAATLRAKAATSVADVASSAASQAARALEATSRAEQEASRGLTELTAQVAETRERLGAVARAAYQSGGGLAGWSALLEPDASGSMAGYQQGSGTVFRGGDRALQQLARQLVELDTIRDRVRGLRAAQRQLVQRAADTQSAAAAAETEAQAAARALEAAEATHAEARTAADTARDEEHRKYEEFLAESEALEAWLAEYSINDTLEGTGSFVRPGIGPLTSPFGPRMHPILGYVRTHPGVDLGRGDGYIYAADHGVVAEATWNDAYGYMVIVDHGLIDGSRVSTLYAHQPGLSVDVGDKVEKGQPIGSIGSTGLSTGPHLHFEVRIEGRPVNPWPWISSAPLPDESGD